MEEKIYEVLKNVKEEEVEFEQEEFEEEEEIVEISENDMLSMLDKVDDPLKICQKLFKQDFEKNQVKILNQEQINELYKKGYFVLDNFLSEDFSKNIFNETMEMISKKELKDPHETQMTKDDIYRDRKARSDIIKWIHENDNLSDNFQTLLGKYKGILSDLDSVMKLRQKREYQLGFYTKNAYYEKHRDSFPDDGTSFERRVTIITYFNTQWKEGDGGELKLFYGKEQIIQPIAGRTVIFLSGVVDHQVLDSKKDRVALTCWVS